MGNECWGMQFFLALLGKFWANGSREKFSTRSKQKYGRGKIVIKNPEFFTQKLFFTYKNMDFSKKNWWSQLKFVTAIISLKSWLASKALFNPAWTSLGRTIWSITGDVGSMIPAKDVRSKSTKNLEIGNSQNLPRVQTPLRPAKVGGVGWSGWDNTHLKKGPQFWPGAKQPTGNFHPQEGPCSPLSYICKSGDN